MTAEITIHGAARTVTGSCFEVAAGGGRLLVDCGMFQGPRSLEALNRQPFGFSPAGLDAVVLTHAHLDHSGLLPRLVAEGFAGPIWCTEPTRDLLGVMLPDAARIHEQDTERRNRRADRADAEPFVPLYTSQDADRAVELARPMALEDAFAAAPGIEAMLWNAGHILGSASVELVAGNARILFSGDLGPGHKSFHSDPAGPHGVDHVFCESTYGDRERETVTADERRRLLQAEVETALARGGNLIIPAFALERTQELLLDLARLIDAGRLDGPRIFVDSPLAGRATDIFERHRAALEDLEGGNPFRHAGFRFVETVDDSIALNNLSGAIIISASGMCTGGRVRHHLVRNLPRRDSTILFVGFQAQGTLGRVLLDGAGRVRISGRDVAVRAAIRRLDCYSAHADRGELSAWIGDRGPIAGSVFLTHGEAGALEALRRDLEKRKLSVIVPEIGERYALSPGVPARRLATGRTDLRPLLERDWQNEYADFAVNLKNRLEKIGSEAERAEAIGRMREILDEYWVSREADGD